MLRHIREAWTAFARRSYRLNKNLRAVRFQPGVEKLEDRDVPSITASINVQAVAQNSETGANQTVSNSESAAASWQVGSSTVSAQSSGSLQFAPHAVTGTANISADEHGSGHPYMAGFGTVTFTGGILLATQSTVTIGVAPQFSHSPGHATKGALYIQIDSHYLFDSINSDLDFLNGSHLVFPQQLSAGAHQFSVSIVTIAEKNDFAPTGPQSSSLSFSVTEAHELSDTTTTLTGTPNPAPYGQEVTFSATVSRVSAGSPAPTGNVTFSDGTTVIGTAALDAAGVATYSTSGLAIGSHLLTAEYGGDSDNRMSSSSPVTQTITRIGTSTSVSSSPNPSEYGQSVAFTAAITAAEHGPYPPTGIVTFYDESAVLGTAAIDALGTARISVSSLAVGPHAITAVYGGDSGYSGSTGAADQTVVALPIPRDLVVDRVSTTDSRRVTVTYHVAGSAVSTPFYINLYRSATPQFDPQNNTLLGSITESGAAVGPHEHSIDLPNGLQPNTELPYVLAVADPDGVVFEGTKANNTAHFHTYVIGAVSVGYDPLAWSSASAPQDWVLRMATQLEEVNHYYRGIPFGWASGSWDQNALVEARSSLLFKIVAEAHTIPDLQRDDVIDVHLIGHSRGSVVINEVAKLLAEVQGFTQLTSGYLKLTMLDPHPANTQLYGFNASAALFAPALALATGYLRFQHSVNDPAIAVPSRVNEVDIAHESTSILDLDSRNGLEQLLNLHGLTPGDITIQDASLTRVLSHDLTGPGMGHSEVHAWYLENVVNHAEYLASGQTPPAFSPPALSISGLLSGDQIRSMTPTSLQSLLVSHSTVSVLVETDTDLQTVIAAVNGLGSSATSAAIDVVLRGGPFSDVALHPPSGVTVLLIGNGTTTAIIGRSPALIVSSGTVFATGITLTTATDDPTILVTDGKLILRDDTIQESTGADDHVIVLTGGALDLGTADSSGGNVLSINGPGGLIQTLFPDRATAIGNTFEIDGAVVPLESITPSSAVDSLPSWTPSLSFAVSWSGRDDIIGSGIAGYDVYVSDNGGPFTSWITTTTQTSAIFPGVAGHTYGFYSIATDGAGLAQRTPAGAQATTTVVLNHAPVLSTIGNRTIDEGVLFTLTAAATDPDAGQSLTFSLANAPAGAVIDPTTGVFSWTPTDGPADATFTVWVTDSGVPALFAEQSFTLNVRNVAPAVTLSAPAVVLAGQPITATGSFTDPAGSADNGYTYRWQILRGATAGSDSGLVATTYAVGAPAFLVVPVGAGRYTVALTVTDKDGGSNTVNRPVDVSPAVVALVRLDAASTNAGAVRFRVSFSDPVSGLGAGNFTVSAGGGVTGAAVIDVVDDGDGLAWTVTVSTGSGDGSVGLNLANTTGLAGPDGVGVLTQTLTGPAYAIDKTGAAVAQFFVLYGNGRRYDLATATRFNLPWAVAGFQVVFTEAVFGTAASLGLTGRNGPLGVSSFSGSGTDTFTWTLADPVTLDRVTAALATQGAVGVRDATGNLLLVARAAFEVSVVFGDAGGDRRVLTADRTQVRNAITAALPYDPFSDVNGDGIVDNADLALVTGRVGTGLV